MDDPHTRATFTKHDSYVFHEDDDIEILIDSDGDTRFYVEIEANAFSTYWDLSLDKPYRDGGPARDNYDFHGSDPVKSGRHHHDPSDVDVGWTAEFAIRRNSFHTTRHSPTRLTLGDHWRVNFSRVHWELEIDAVTNTYTRVGTFGDEENWIWSPQGLIIMHYPEMWGFVQFSQDVAGTAVEPFVWNPVGDVQWALRWGYYREQTYYDDHERYIDALEYLELPSISLDGYSRPPQITASAEAFTTSVEEELESEPTGIQRNTWGPVKAPLASEH